jgi:hypothetical protein
MQSGAAIFSPATANTRTNNTIKLWWSIVVHVVSLFFSFRARTGTDGISTATHCNERKRRGKKPCLYTLEAVRGVSVVSVVVVLLVVGC